MATSTERRAMTDTEALEAFRALMATYNVLSFLTGRGLVAWAPSADEWRRGARQAARDLHDAVASS